MWQWDQGRLAYFQFDALRQMSVFAMSHDFVVASREELETATGLPFTAGPNKPWRNFARVLKRCLLVSELGPGRRKHSVPTKVADLLSRPGAITCDEYFHFFARAFTEPSPASLDWIPNAHYRFPLLFTLRYLLAKRAILHEPVTSLEEILGAYEQTGFVGDESDDAFIQVVGRHRRFRAAGQRAVAREDPRQARESIQVLSSQISYLRFEQVGSASSGGLKFRIILSLDAPRAMSFFQSLRPVQGPTAPDSESEIRRLADHFSAESDRGFEEYLDAAANDVVQSGFVEGTRVKKTHLVIERNSGLRRAFFDSNPTLVCDVCSLDTEATYPWAGRVLDLHHLLPLSSGIHIRVNERRDTTFEDLVPVCPSCHRAIHRFYDRWLKGAGLADFPDKKQARVVYGNLKAGFNGAVHV
jgi:hypothetical protein